MPSIRAISLLAFGAVATVLLVVSAVGYRALRQAEEANQAVIHTHEMLNALENVLTTMVDAEAGARGFDATGLSRYLEPFERAKSELGRHVDAVATLTKDNASQQRRVEQLRSQTGATLAFLQEIVEVARAERFIEIELRDREKTSMDGVRATIQQMSLEEEQLIGLRSLNAARASTAMQSAMFGLIGAAFGVLVVSFLFVDRRAIQLRQANESLSVRVAERTAELERALIEEEKARKEAQEANRLRDEFLMTVSHELRGPLTAIYGWSSIMLNGEVKEEQRRHAVEAIYRSAHAQTRLVNDLLDVSRAISGKLQLNVDLVELEELVGAVVTAVRPESEAKAVRIEAVVDHAAVVSGDRDRLHQVVSNLALNAIKFTPSGGTVEVRLSRLDDSAVIKVTDSGEGIEPEFLPFVFDRFRQDDATHRGAQSGLGLGLAIVRTIVELHGGRVHAHSEGKGHGAIFQVRLPVDPQPQHARSVSRKESPVGLSQQS
jgi:signal transduction histidine kinase